MCYELLVTQLITHNSNLIANKIMVGFFQKIGSLVLALAVAQGATAQGEIVVGDKFTSSYIQPLLLRDGTNSKTIDQIASAEHQWDFRQAETPFVNKGPDAANWWLLFRVKNNLPTRRTFIVQVNRKNFDLLQLWQRDTNGICQPLGLVGMNAPDQSNYFLTDGYYFGVTLPPHRVTEIYGLAYNRVGNLFFGLTLHTQQDFSLDLRQSVLTFGLFLGVMAVTVLFSLFLFLQFRDRIYLYYLLYILNILARQAHEFSTDFGLLPFVQRHATSVMLAATFGMFFRHFLRLWNLVPALDWAIKMYVRVIFVAAILVSGLTAFDALAPFGWAISVLNFTNLLFTVVALTAAVLFSGKSARAQITLLAYLPLGLAFLTVILRNMDLLPDFPWIRFSIMWAFVFEVMVYTIGFLLLYRSVETDKQVLTLQLEQEELEKQLAVATAEQRVKDRIARDLHDDVAASLSGIRILSQVAKTQFSEKSPEAAPILEQIARTAQSAVESIGDLIWAVKPSENYLNDLADRIREHAVKLLEAKDIDYRINIPRDLPVLDLNLETKRNLYLIFKEALNNALKYSQCTAVEIHLSLENGLLQMAISDNGVGFEPSQISGGNGLRNMVQRGADVGGEVSIDSAPGRGTSVNFALKIGKTR